MKRYVKLTALLILLSFTLISCAGVDAAFYEREGTFKDYDIIKDLGLEFEDNVEVDSPFSDMIIEEDSEPNYYIPYVFRMRTVEEMTVYDTLGGKTVVEVLPAGSVVDLEETEVSDWMAVKSKEGEIVGYTDNAFMKAINSDCGIYAELPIEYGQAKTNSGTYVDAYSHLVDVRKYFKAYESTEYSNDGVDFSNYDIKISMKLSTNETSIGEPFYERNLCLLQYDILGKLKKAIDLFKKDGYIVVIYDAYRPTSVQQRWFNVVRVHKWVADPSIGMGGIHDRGTAIDMSHISIKTGKELEMPTPMHTFTEASARSSSTMSKTARENMNYMLKIMTQCGFTYINSEWWHFQDVDTQYYLPTDHPIDSIPLTVVEN